MFRVSLSAAVILATPVALVADAAQHGKIGFYDVTLAQCFVRDYDAAHMTAHPKQKVSGIAFATVPGELITTAAGEVMFAYTLSATMAGIDPVMANPGVCYPGMTADQLECAGEGDGGLFTLTRQADGTLRLDNPDAITVINDSAADIDPEGEYVHIAAVDDQAVFRLSPATTGLCVPQLPNPG